jgi:hypothetical protein
MRGWWVSTHGSLRIYLDYRVNQVSMQAGAAHGG